MEKKHSTIISLIIPAKNEGLFVEKTIKSILQSKTSYIIEIIVVDDASIDGCCSFLANQLDIKRIRTHGVGSAMARNIGAEQAIGDYLIFCDAHLYFEDYLIDRLIEPLTLGIADAINPGIADSSDINRKGFGYTWNNHLEPKWNTKIESLTIAPLLAGGCLAISKDIFIDVGGFERGFKIWGREDEEISLKLWLFGYTCCVTPITTAIHFFRTDSPPYHLNWDDLNYNMMRMAYSHFKEERIRKCEKMINYSDPKEIISHVLQSNVLKQREKYYKRRIHDDDWYMSKFGINF